MLFEKEITRDIQHFQKLCKEKKQYLLQVYKDEEKELSENFFRTYKELVKSHKKQLNDLQSKVEKSKKKFRRHLECELRSEKKSLKKLYNRKSQSISHLMNFNDLPVTSFSLSNLQISQNTTHNNNNNTDNHSLIEHSNISSQLPTETSSISPPSLLNHLNKFEAKKNGRSIHLNKHLSKSEHMLNTTRKSSSLIENDLKKFNNELEERFYNRLMENKNILAELEWKCLLERQELRRAYLLNLGELKQRRLMSLGNMTRLQTKSYFDIQRKWLCEIHTNELSQRNHTSHETLKKLGESQTVERQTACKLLKQSIQGQKQIIRILENLLKKDKHVDQTNSPPNFNEYQQSTSILDRLVETSPYLVTEEYSSEDIITGNQKNHFIPMTYASSPVTSINEGSHSSHSNSSAISQKLKHSNENIYQFKQSNLRNKIVEIPTDLQNSVHQQNEMLTRAKSTQSIQSTISAYESLSRTILNIITTRQSDLWTNILEQQQSVTENLLKSQTEQLKLLITSENAALKRCQMDFDSRAAYLSVTLEATQKFAEKEFAEEQERTIQFYFNNINTNNLSTISRYQSENFQTEHILHDTNNDNEPPMMKNITVNTDESPESILPVSSAIRKFENCTNEYGQKIIPITFKKTPSSSSSSKFNSTSIQREHFPQQDRN
ncbi:unnamed protein product [Schistosoma turkestanicum]|nr:unnamed protein product [Schistosoma turkestanicum]